MNWPALIPIAFFLLKDAATLRRSVVKAPPHHGQLRDRPDVILPFLRPIAHLIHDPDLSEIMVHCGGVS
jgi:hypothetical protein